MSTQSRIIEALAESIQMEIEGKDFYLKASALSGNELGKKLLATLAEEEDEHRRRFSEIYDVLRRKMAWSQDIKLPQSRIERVTLRSLLGDYTDVPKVGQGEIDAVKLAMGLEDKTHDFYIGRAGVADSESEREFYSAIAAEESRHKLALLDYYEYLRDPASWFVKKEHPSLDGA